MGTTATLDPNRNDKSSGPKYPDRDRGGPGRNGKSSNTSDEYPDWEVLARNDKNSYVKYPDWKNDDDKHPDRVDPNRIQCQVHCQPCRGLERSKCRRGIKSR